MTSKEHINKKRDQLLLISFVRWARLELAQDYSHYPLKVACLPFHHHRFVCFGIAKVRTFFKLPNFSALFLQKFSLFLFGHVFEYAQSIHFQRNHCILIFIYYLCALFLG